MCISEYAVHIIPPTNHVSGLAQSTIARLLLRFYNPTHGEIKVDNQDISTVTQVMVGFKTSRGPISG